jgi:glycosyltransferase involved in cell wall biosynthesis
MTPQRVLVAHCAYQHRGGEDAVVEAETALLRGHGHTVATYLRDNADVAALSSAALAAQTLWSRRAARELAAEIDRFRPDVIHVHNTLPLISPAAYWVAARARVPVVQTLHNFRPLCLNGLFLRAGAVCEDCVGRLPWRGAAHGCYRGSRAASGVLAATVGLHRAIGTYHRKVSRYIALNDFCRDRFIAGGLPAERIAVKPNFVDAPPPPAGPRAGFLFVGRLSVEKGIATLAQAARMASVEASGAVLRVAGDGPAAAMLDGAPGVTRLGALPPHVVRGEMERAAALVVPSVWYENFPRTIVEAFAAGLPVIASRIGALASIVSHGDTGLLFEPGNAHDLARTLADAAARPQELAAMGQRARARYEAEFSADVNYRALVDIYGEAAAQHARDTGTAADAPSKRGAAR